MKISQMFFNCWEFKTDNKIDSDSLRLSTKNSIFTEIAEESLKKVLA